jgi:hypothetical protein
VVVAPEKDLKGSYKGLLKSPVNSAPLKGDLERVATFKWLALSAPPKNSPGTKII